MLKRLEFLIILLTFSFWPLGLYLVNTRGDFFKYTLPAVFVIFSFLSFRAKSAFGVLPLLIIPFIEPKLASLPLSVILLLWLWNRTEKKYLFFLFISLGILLFNWKAFFGQTIFKPDYEARQQMIGKLYLYPNVFTARLFQNKVRIYNDKFSNNFFALVDPNNYFFGFHPREILIDNQNLNKYPFLSIVFLLFGLYYLRQNPLFKFITALVLGSIISLSILTIFDRNDFILWFPFSLILFYGLMRLKDNLGERKWLVFLLLFLAFSTIEFLRVLVE